MDIDLKQQPDSILEESKSIVESEGFYSFDGVSEGRDWDLKETYRPVTKSLIQYP